MSLYVFLKTHFLVSFSYNHLLIRRIKVSQFEFLRKGWQLNTLPWLCVFDSCLCLNLKIFFRLETTFNTEMHGYFFLLPLLSYYFLNFFLKFLIKFMLITINWRCQYFVLKPLPPKPEIHWINFLCICHRW